MLRRLLFGTLPPERNRVGGPCALTNSAGTFSPRWRVSFAIRFLRTSATSKVGVHGVGGKSVEVAQAVEGEGGIDVQRWSVGDTVMVFMQRYNGLGLSADFLPRAGKPGGVTGKDSVLCMLEGSETSEADGVWKDAVEAELNDDTEGDSLW